MNTQIRILIVDDFELGRSQLRRCLKDLGYSNLDDAADGKIALDKLNKAHSENNPFSVVFTDWNMPVMNGMELIQNCKKNLEFKNLKLIMVTAEGELKNIVQAVSAGIDGYIIKPIEPDKIDMKLKSLFSSDSVAS